MIKKRTFAVFWTILLVSIISNAQIKERVLSNVNSAYDEQNPVLAPDGLTLYFTRSNHPENEGGSRDQGDIWASTLTSDNQWSSPQRVVTLNNSNWNGVIGFSNDGTTVYLYNHYSQVNGMVKTQGISKSAKTRQGWSPPEDIMIPYFRNISKNPGGSISKDGKVLLLSMESYATKGVEDIYVCLKKDNGSWSEPQNIGVPVNTKFQEFSPYMSDDSRILYFSSNGHGGRGSSDVFMSERLDDSWKNWSQPKALSGINTKGRETGYRRYGAFSLYASTINSDGYSDIRYYSDPPIDSVMEENEDEIIADADIAVSERDLENIILAENILKIYGRVYNEETRESVNAIVTIENGREDFKKEVSAKGDDGYYSVIIPTSGQYDVRIDAPGYISKRETLDVYTGVAEKEANFPLKAISIGATVNLKNVLFEQSKPTILESSYNELDLVVDLMKQNPTMKIRLEGHTDNRGVPKYNMRLSKKRADAVEDYLVKNGISKRRISGKGYGGSKPIANNDDPELRKLNRRVEFTIVKE